jgi:hypothetical protein
MGEDSWKWPTMPSSKQKLVVPSMFDPNGEIFKKGSSYASVDLLG